MLEIGHLRNYIGNWIGVHTDGIRSHRARKGRCSTCSPRAGALLLSSLSVLPELSHHEPPKPQRGDLGRPPCPRL